MPRDFLDAFTSFLIENRDKERAVKEKAYLYSDLTHYGISAPQIRSFFKEHKKKIAALSKPDALNLVTTLWSKPSHEERNMALTILVTHKDSLAKQDMPLIEKLMRESRGWALLDNLIIPVMPTLLSQDKSVYDYLKKWISDDDFWVRRSALLAQLLFFRNGINGDKQFFFDLAESQFDEKWIDDVYKKNEERKRARFFIRKAIGWTLRELSAKDPTSVRQFLVKHKDSMSGLTYREGSRKL